MDGLKRKISQKKFQNTLPKRNLGRREIKNSKTYEERKADDLVEKWGFNRVYNDYEQFERLAKINQIKQK